MDNEKQPITESKPSIAELVASAIAAAEADKEKIQSAVAEEPAPLSDWAMFAHDGFRYVGLAAWVAVSPGDEYKLK